MANTAQARKRARQNDVRRVHNHARRASMRTAIKALLASIAAGDKTEAEAAYRTAVSQIDRTARRDLSHKNKAARLKSRLNARLKSLSA